MLAGGLSGTTTYRRPMNTTPVTTAYSASWWCHLQEGVCTMSVRVDLIL